MTTKEGRAGLRARQGRDLLRRLARGGYSLAVDQRLDVIDLDGPATADEVEDAAVAKLIEVEAR